VFFATGWSERTETPGVPWASGQLGRGVDVQV
jgi:hypothetical protein